ncbi:46196_t:CDS:1, partial [Gigaspora margarita]
IEAKHLANSETCPDISNQARKAVIVDVAAGNRVQFTSAANSTKVLYAFSSLFL